MLLTLHIFHHPLFMCLPFTLPYHSITIVSFSFSIFHFPLSLSPHAFSFFTFTVTHTVGLCSVWDTSDLTLCTLVVITAHELHILFHSMASVKLVLQCDLMQ